MTRLWIPVNPSLSAVLGLFLFFVFHRSPLGILISPFVFFVKIEPQMSVFAVLLLLLAICICCIKCESVYLLDFSRVQRILCISRCSINCLFLFLFSRYRLLYVKSGLFSVLSDSLLSPMNFFCVFVTMLKKIRKRFFFSFLRFPLGNSLCIINTTIFNICVSLS